MVHFLSELFTSNTLFTLAAAVIFGLLKKYFFNNWNSVDFISAIKISIYWGFVVRIVAIIFPPLFTMLFF